MKKNINLEVHDLFTQECDLYTFEESILNIKLMNKELNEKYEKYIKNKNKNKNKNKINKKEKHNEINNIEPYVESYLRRRIVSREI